MQHAEPRLSCSFSASHVSVSNGDREPFPTCMCRLNSSVGPSSSAVIGIEGIACRLPSAAKLDSPQSDKLMHVPLDRWDVELQADSVTGGRFGGFIEGYAAFDAAAFGISPSEAAFMDPAQRVLLEVRHSPIIFRRKQLPTMESSSA